MNLDGVKKEVRQLLKHDKKKASGLMTTAYLSATPDTSVEMVITRLRVEAPNLDIMHYIYVVDRGNVLQGVVSIRGLLTAQPHQLLTEIWTQRLISVKAEANQKEILEAFAKYRLQALPVLDEGNHLKGVIRLQTMLDILLPKVR